MGLREYLAIAKLVAVLALVAWAIRLNDLRERWHHQWESEHAGRMADRATYEAAQVKAAADNKAHVQTIEQQYQRNSDETKDAYARDHAELVRLRKQRDAAAKGASGSAGASPDHAAGPRADGDGVPVPPADDLQETRDDAADIELRLMHLQRYVEGLLKVDPNK